MAEHWLIFADGTSRRVDRTLSVGRARECDLNWEDPTVSVRHAVFEPHPSGVLVLTDQGSTNGTYVNGYRIEACSLPDQSQIVIGRQTMTYRLA